MAALAGCASPRLDVPRPVSQALQATAGLPLAQAFGAQAAAHPGASGFQLLYSGHGAFVSRTALADLARRTLDLQYYSVGDDLATDVLLDRLGAAAARGVRVRVLLDDVHATARTFAVRATALHADIQVRLFNPFLNSADSTLLRLGEFLLQGGRLNRRMHNKLWVADNAVAIFGSRNLGDEYFGNGSANFMDVELLAAGPIVPELSRVFDAYWNSESAWPAQSFGLRPDPDTTREVRIALDRRLASCRTGAGSNREATGAPVCRWRGETGVGEALRGGQLALTWGAATVAHDPPDGPKVEVLAGIAHAPHAAHADGRPPGELLIASPYFIPGEEGVAHLATMRRGGDRVVVLTNSLASTDSPAAHAGYAARRLQLLDHGVALHEVRPATGHRPRRAHRWGRVSADSLHAKFIVQDRRHVIIGSRNQDPRSRLHNTESWVTVDSADLAAELAALFEEGTDLQQAFRLERDARRGGALSWLAEEEGGIVRHRSEPQAGLLLRWWRAILSTLLPEHLL